MMLTGDARLETVVAAVNRGEIFRFFVKPANEAEIIVSVREALKARALKQQTGRLLQTVRKQGETLRSVSTPIGGGQAGGARPAGDPSARKSSGDEASPEVISLDGNLSDDVDGLLDEIKTELDKLEG
jgi:hypothetical protein